MRTGYQAKLTRAGAPLCRYCGVRLPKRLHARGMCDFCKEAHMDDPRAFWQYDPERDFDTDAITFEQEGPYEPEPLPKIDSVTLAVEREREENERRFFGVEPSRLRQRIAARARGGR